MVMFGFSRIKLASDQTFYRIKCIVRIGHHLTLGGCTDQTLIVGKGHDGWCGVIAFRVGNHFRFIAFHDRYARVGGSEVNSYYFRHFISPDQFLINLLINYLMYLVMGNLMLRFNPSALICLKNQLFGRTTRHQHLGGANQTTVQGIAGRMLGNHSAFRFITRHLC